MKHQATSIKNRRKWWRLQLSSLLFIVTIFAVLSAWLVDHRNLRSQIKPAETKFAVVYQLQNASVNRVISELSSLYPNQRFVSVSNKKLTGIAKTQQDQSVIVACDASVRHQIAIIIQHFDRKNTDMIEIETVAEKQSSANNSR
ncbi:hypothetical protein OAG71_00490 [bacterium]|nr:hypothetical protein [bacterium]